jgi:hypothetical protein
MTYGFRPEHWWSFEWEMDHRGIRAADIEKVELREGTTAADMTVVVTLRSGRVETWEQPQRPSL